MVEVATVLAGLAGIVTGALTGHKGVHVNPGAVPDSAVYLTATVENPYPVKALEAKSIFTVAHHTGDFVASLIKAIKGKG